MSRRAAILAARSSCEGHGVGSQPDVAGSEFIKVGTDISDRGDFRRDHFALGSEASSLGREGADVDPNTSRERSDVRCLGDNQKCETVRGGYGRLLGFYHGTEELPAVVPASVGCAVSARRTSTFAGEGVGREGRTETLWVEFQP